MYSQSDIEERSPANIQGYSTPAMLEIDRLNQRLHELESELRASKLREKDLYSKYMELKLQAPTIIVKSVEPGIASLWLSLSGLSLSLSPPFALLLYAPPSRFPLTLRIVNIPTDISKVKIDEVIKKLSEISGKRARWLRVLTFQLGESASN
jgi:hypothetical protein